MFKKNYLKLKQNKKRYICLISVFFIFFIGGVNISNAGWFDFVVDTAAGDSIGRVMGGILTGILSTLISLFGTFFLWLIGALIAIIAYSEIPGPVTEGWIIIRDISNMFFIVMLMIIAVSTILRIETYNYKKMLPKLLLMAVLINFSKMFTLLLIDVSQIATLTFFNTFKGNIAGNFVNSFGLNGVMTFASKATNIDYGSVILSMFLDIAFLIIATIVVSSLFFMFLARIVSFWILIVLSPIIYFGSAAGGAWSKYSERWWSSFTKNLLIGPALGFFLWLSLSIMSEDISKSPLLGIAVAPIGSSGVGEPQTIMRFFISTAMLIGSLFAAQEVGATGASGAMAFAKKGGIIGKMRAPAAWTAAHLTAATGFDVNPMHYYTNIKKGFEEKRKHLDRDAGLAIMERSKKGGFFNNLNSFAAEGAVEHNLQGLFWHKAWLGEKDEAGKFRLGKGRMFASAEERQALIDRQAPVTETKAKMVEYQGYEKAFSDDFNSDNIKNNEAQIEVINNHIETLEKNKRNTPNEQTRAGFDDKIKKQIELRGEIEKKNEILKGDMNSDMINKVRQEKNGVSFGHVVKNNKKMASIDSDIAQLKERQDASKDNTEKENIAKQIDDKKIERSVFELENKKIKEDIVSALSTTFANVEFSKKISQNNKDLDALNTENITLQIQKSTADPKQLASINDKIVENEKLRDKKKTEIGNIESEMFYKVIRQAELEEDFKGRTVEGKRVDIKSKEDLASVKALEDVFKKEISFTSRQIPKMVQEQYAWNAAVSEQSKHVTSENEDELVDQFGGAMANNNKALAVAIAKRLTKVGGLNNLLNTYGYDANQDGLNSLINQKFINELGMDRQTALSAQADLGGIAKQIGHWTYADGVMMKHGQLQQQSMIEQNAGVYSEMAKGGQEQFFRNNNRLAIGGEDAEGNFTINASGAHYVINNLESAKAQMGNGRLNESMAKALAQDNTMAVLMKLAKGDPEKVAILKKIRDYGLNKTTKDMDKKMTDISSMIADASK